MSVSARHGGVSVAPELDEKQRREHPGSQTTNHPEVSRMISQWRQGDPATTLSDASKQMRAVVRTAWCKEIALLPSTRRGSGWENWRDDSDTSPHRHTTPRGGGGGEGKRTRRRRRWRRRAEREEDKHDTSEAGAPQADTQHQASRRRALPE